MVSPLLTFITSAILFLSTVSFTSQNDAEHIGCFKTNLVDTQPSYYKIKDPLSWETGVAACLHRYTTHMAVQAVNRTSSMSSFFCGNDLLAHSVKLEDSACAPCVYHTDRYCGGPQAISIYKLRDQTPLVILIASNEGVALLEFDGFNSNYSTLLAQSPDMTIELLYSEDEIVFREVNSIFRSLFDLQQTEYSTPSRIVDGSNDDSGFAIDWVENKIFFCGDKTIKEHNMMSNETKEVYATSEDCVDIAIDPYTRTLFVAFSFGSLSSFSLLTNKFSHIGEQLDLFDVNRVAVDYHNQLIYVTTALRPDNTYGIVRINYAGTNMTVMMSNPDQFSWFMGLDVTEDSIILVRNVNWKNSTVYICKPSPVCEQDNIKALHSSSNINYVTTYHPLKQTPSEAHLCSSRGCSHNCKRMSLFMASCSCPEGLTLGADNATCQAEDVRHVQFCTLSVRKFLPCPGTVHFISSTYQTKSVGRLSVNSPGNGTREVASTTFTPTTRTTEVITGVTKKITMTTPAETITSIIDYITPSTSINRDQDSRMNLFIIITVLVLLLVCLSSLVILYFSHFNLFRETSSGRHTCTEQEVTNNEYCVSYNVLNQTR